MAVDVERVALVGATGGAGTTRLSMEFAAILAREGRDVAVFDAAFATQGLAQYVRGNINRDVTRLVTDSEADPEEALVDYAIDVPGEVSVCPAHAALGTLARAKTQSAAERFGTIVRQAGSAFDHVIVDTPPVAANQSVAAVQAVDRVGLVAPADRRSGETVRPLRKRLGEIDATVDRVIANRAADAWIGGEDERPPIPQADVAIPESDVTGVRGAPACADDDAEPAFQAAVLHAVEDLFDTTLQIEISDSGLLGGPLLSGF